MRSHIAGTLAALAIGADAFLLPPGINNIDSPKAVSSVINPNTQAIKLPCSDCVFSTRGEERVSEVDQEDRDDGQFWVQGGARNILLNFSLSEDARAVKINDWQLYPITLDNSELPSVSEIAASTSLVDLKEHPEKATTVDVSGASIFVNKELVSPAGDKVVKVGYQVISLQGQKISVDGAKIELLEGADGAMMILSVEAVPKAHSLFDGMPFVHPPHSQSTDDEHDCSMLPVALCKWKAMIGSKLQGFKQGVPHKFGGKGCGGRQGAHKLPGHIKPHFGHMDKPGDEERPRHHQGRPGHHGPHGPHAMHKGPHHHGRHHFLHRVVRAFVFVLMPVVAGITMGLAVSVFGMVIGRLIALMWIKYRRGGRRGYASVAQVEVDNNDTEKGAVVEHVEEEPLPVYEVAPAYEEKQ